mmetsp:Transcript_19845/g.42214  ORF Transcript_19845/g.42214 Transcript_19845/m.42214 type:complete len:230 (-) Transcript_19845:207-896(-)
MSLASQWSLPCFSSLRAAAAASCCACRSFSASFCFRRSSACMMASIELIFALPPDGPALGPTADAPLAAASPASSASLGRFAFAPSCRPKEIFSALSSRSTSVGAAVSSAWAWLAFTIRWMSRRCFSSESRAARSRLARASILARVSGSRSIYVTNHPFSVSSTSHLPVRPRYITKSVSVSQIVEFMCVCSLKPMYSLYSVFAATRCDFAFRLISSIIPSSNCEENSSM